MVIGGIHIHCIVSECVYNNGLAQCANTCPDLTCDNVNVDVPDFTCDSYCPHTEDISV